MERAVVMVMKGRESEKRKSSTVGRCGQGARYSELRGRHHKSLAYLASISACDSKGASPPIWSLSISPMGGMMLRATWREASHNAERIIALAQCK
jgi:hypothetical protein